MFQENLEQYCQKVAQHHSNLLIEDLEYQETLWEDLNGRELEAVVGGEASLTPAVLAFTAAFLVGVAASTAANDSQLGEAYLNRINGAINNLAGTG